MVVVVCIWVFIVVVVVFVWVCVVFIVIVLVCYDNIVFDGVIVVDNLLVRVVYCLVSVCKLLVVICSWVWVLLVIFMLGMLVGYLGGCILL